MYVNHTIVLLWGFPVSVQCSNIKMAGSLNLIDMRMFGVQYITICSFGVLLQGRG